jgi:hypothetical protein
MSVFERPVHGLGSISSGRAFISQDVRPFESLTAWDHFKIAAYKMLDRVKLWIS